MTPPGVSKGRLAVLLAVGLAGCSRAEPDLGPGQVDPFAGRSPSAFRVSLILSDVELGRALARSSCEVPVQSERIFLDARMPEANLLASMGRSPMPAAVSATDEDGIAGLVELAAGIHVLELSAETLPLRARLQISLSTRRTDVRGFIGPDVTDLDQDGDKAEWLLAVEALPDDDGDLVSDTGLRTRATFGMLGSVLFRHLGRGTSERVELDAELNEVSSLPFADRDGDFLADDVDADADGSGEPDLTEGNKLPCPGFSHDDLFRDGSKHAAFRCDTCHLVDDERPLVCADCHAPDAQAPAITPTPPVDHFARGCEQCHRADRPWAEVPGPSGELHLAYPLIGQHVTADCMGCHVSGRRKPEKLCESCHLQDSAPGHEKTNCQSCHNPRAWTDVTTSHEQFPLSGGHAALTCEQCHVGGTFPGLQKACATCHLADAPPKHEPAGFNAEPCETCHQLSSFADTRYTHPDWTLLGKHQTLKCDACHGANPTDYSGNAQACDTCHQTPSYPDHGAFGLSCEGCHSEAGWVPATTANFDHSQWPLVGAHQTALCSTCHQGGARPNPPIDCAGCHEAERPARHAGTFDGDCVLCHQSTTFADLLFPYVHTAAFPLDGAHAVQTCARCHVTAYQVSPACVGCHLADEPPNHYGSDCRACHTTADWNPSGGSNHHSADPGALPLTLGHAGLLCTQCHTSGYSAIPSSCESCHNSDMPLGHASAGCANCHTAGVWQNATSPPANGMHPLAGGHTGRTCVSCHGNFTAASGFATPSPSADCATCHTTPGGHIPIGTAACSSCHTVDAFAPAEGGHTGPVPTSPFPYNTWSGRWFPVPHHGADRCNECHTTVDSGGGFEFFSCTTGCHRGLDPHEGSLFHFNPNEANNPPDQGGAIWPTGHVGCVKSNCHADGRS